MSPRVRLIGLVLATTALSPLVPGGGALAQTVPEMGETAGDATGDTMGAPEAAAGDVFILPADSVPFVTLDEIVISATRNPISLIDTPTTMSVVTARQIEDRLVTTIGDLVRYEPGVGVGGDPTRTGTTSYVIRGIGGNRVMLMSDGLRLPDFEEFGHTYARDIVDVDTLSRVEIIRGPGSALFGSDAMGGVVSYFTKDPADYLGLFGRDYYVSTKVNYDSASETFSETGTVAIDAGNVEMLAVVTRRDGHETQPNGDADPNPQDFSATSFLGKLVFYPNDADVFRITGEYRTSRLDTEIDTALSSTVLASTSEDEFNRWRLSVEHEHSEPIGFIDSFLWRVGVQHLERHDHQEQYRVHTMAGPFTYCDFGMPINVFAGHCTVVSDYDFTQTILSAEAQFHSSFTLFGDVENRLTYGIDVSATESAQPRDRTGIYHASAGFEMFDGTETKTILGETYPGKYFPDSTTLEIGFYVQDEIVIGDTGLTLFPAVRFDYYGLFVEPDDEFYLANGADAEAEDAEWFAVSPKLGLVYDLSDELSIYGQYARGFRAPPYYEASAGFTNTSILYEIVPTTDLDPETSDNFEIGLRGSFADGSSFTLSAFYSIYENFLSAECLDDDGNCDDGLSEGYIQQFQYVNLDQVTIWGIEGTAAIALGHGFTALGAFAFARGEDDQGEPVNEVEPFKLVAGLRWDDPGLGLGIEFTGTYRAEHDRVTEGTFVAPESTVFDLTASWDVTPNFTIAGGVFNITDELYWNPQDVAWGGSDVAANPDLYSQPGRNFAVSATLRW